MACRTAKGEEGGKRDYEGRLEREREREREREEGWETDITSVPATHPGWLWLTAEGYHLWGWSDE
jgi:hypothetical protein